MKKRIIVAEFHNGYAPFLVGGRKNVNEYKKAVNDNGFIRFIRERKLVVDVPGVIFGTPEDWDIEFSQALSDAWSKPLTQ